MGVRLSGAAGAAGGYYATARRLLEEGLAEKPGHPSLLYDLACAEALAGDVDAALGHVILAVEANGRLRERAQADPDFDAIRDDPRFPK